MTTTGMVTMALVLAFVWGGFLLILRAASRKEKQKREGES